MVESQDLSKIPRLGWRVENANSRHILQYVKLAESDEVSEDDRLRLSNK